MNFLAAVYSLMVGLVVFALAAAIGDRLAFRRGHDQIGDNGMRPWR